MKLETAKELENYIDQKNVVKNGGLFCSAEIYTEPKMTVKHRVTGLPCKYSKVYKVQKITACIGFDYENVVNGRREKEGLDRDFSAGELKGRHHVTRTILESDKDAGQFYMQLFFFRKDFQTFSVYINGADGEEITGNDLDDLKIGFLPKHYENVSQGVENPILTITPKLENIHVFKCGEFSYMHRR